MQRRAWIALIGALAVPGLTAATALPAGETEDARPATPPGRLAPLEAPDPAMRMLDSRSLGLPTHGRLVRGVRLPPRGEHYATWDSVLGHSPNRWWRRYGNDYLIRMLLRVARRHAGADPEPPLPMLVGDLSRPRGGDFGRRFGALGHSSHQNGLDADVYYPRRDRRAAPPRTVGQVDIRLAQRLVDLFVAAGAQTVLVGPHLPLKGPRGVVKPWPHHDNHLHVRIANPEPEETSR
jgi:penicillin-insensitive murein endopeptidase